MGHSGERHPRLVSWATVGKDILGWYNGSQWGKDRILMARETQQERQTPARKQIGKWKLRDSWNQILQVLQWITTGKIFRCTVLEYVM